METSVLYKLSSSERTSPSAILLEDLRGLSNRLICTGPPEFKKELWVDHSILPLIISGSACDNGRIMQKGG